MPTIEIVSLDAKMPILNQNDYDIAIIEESELRTHRALFDGFLRDKSGLMVHLGNPDMKSDKEGGFWAGKIINWEVSPGNLTIPAFNDGETGADQDERFKFKDKYEVEVRRLVELYLNQSPLKVAYFLTDYQFGPAKASYAQVTLNQFWQEHRDAGLYWNRLYILMK